MQAYTIGIAEMKVAKAPDRIVTLGLGSCVGLTLYDPMTKIGGMVHIMLPSSAEMSDPANKAKFADTAVPVLINAMVKAGANRLMLRAKLTGGASMFQSTGSNSLMNIGERNAKMCKEALKAQRINVMSEDIGGKSGRSIELNCDTGELQIRTVAPKSIRLI